MQTLSPIGRHIVTFAKQYREGELRRLWVLPRCVGEEEVAGCDAEEVGMSAP